MALGCVSRIPVDIILFCSFPLIVIVVKDGMAQLHTGDLRGQESLKNFILRENAGETDYFCRETGTYICCGKEIKGQYGRQERRK